MLLQYHNYNEILMQLYKLLLSMIAKIKKIELLESLKNRHEKRAIEILVIF